MRFRSLALHRKSLPGRAASGGRLQEEPRPAPGTIGRRVRARGWKRRNMDLKTSQRGRGAIIDFWRGAVRLAGFMPGFVEGMKRDGRVSCAFARLEISEALSGAERAG